MRRKRLIGLFALLAATLAVGGCFLFPNRAPEAAFTASYSEDPAEPLVVILDASASTDPDGDAIAAYMWDFDVDEPGVEFLPLGYTTRTVTEPIVKVRYPLQGTYTVTLAVRDDREPGKVSLQVAHDVTLPNPGVVPMR